jgi:hypothetical protein
MVKLYLSHQISDGGAHDIDRQKENCQLAIKFGNRIRSEFPGIELYIPAESEPFVGRAYHGGFLSIPQILRIDCRIIDSCDGVLVYDRGHISRGMEVEITHAIQNGIPVQYLSDDFSAAALIGWKEMITDE